MPSCTRDSCPLLTTYYLLLVTVVHYLLAAVEFTFINYFILLKFEPGHRLMHRIPPLYRMTHYEHHVNKHTETSTRHLG